MDGLYCPPVIVAISSHCHSGRQVDRHFSETESEGMHCRTAHAAELRRIKRNSERRASTVYREGVSGVDDDGKPHGAQTPQTSRARGRQSGRRLAA